MKKGGAGDSEGKILIETLKKQRVVAGNNDLAEEIASIGERVEVKAGNAIIEQGSDDSYVYLILTGSFDILVNGKAIGRRFPNDHVGEMAAIQPNQRRSASVVAHEDSAAIKLSEPKLAELCARHPQILRVFASELARRLEQRNTLVSAVSEKVRVLILSSEEGRKVARTIERAFKHEPFHVSIWAEGSFRSAHYSIETLERALDKADVAIAIAELDDTARENVLFELGFLMGRLGRHRTLLVEPRGENLELAPCLAGINTITYKHAETKDLTHALEPACTRLRDLIRDLGPNR